MVRQLPHTIPLLALGCAVALGGLAVKPAVGQRVGVTAAVTASAARTPPGLGMRQVVIGDEIVYDEVIETDAFGRTQVLLADRTALSIGPNSSLKIDRFVYDPQTKSGDMALTLRRGLLRFVGGRISKSNEAKITTPLGVLGVRGGVALVEVPDEGTVHAAFLFGEAMTVKMGGALVTQISRPGFGTTVTADGATPPRRWGTGRIQGLMQALQGREGSNGGLERQPDASLIRLLAEGALPNADRIALANAIHARLGPPPGVTGPGTLQPVISTGQQQMVEDRLAMRPIEDPLARRLPVSAIARQTDHQGGGNSVVTGFTEASETIQLIAPGVIPNTASIGYDPTLGLYYGSRAGSSNHAAAVWDRQGQLVQALSPMGIDARAWNFNPNTGDIEVITFQTRLEAANRDADGQLLGTYTPILDHFAGSPVEQTMPAYNPATNEFYAKGTGGTVTVLDAATGTTTATIALDLAAAGIADLADYFIGFEPGDNTLIGVQNANAYVFGLDGQFIRRAPLTVTADGNFDAGYANEQLFVYHPQIFGFQGFSLDSAFTDGRGVFTLNNAAGSLSGMPLNLMTGTGEGPLSIHNPFDPTDSNLYDHPSIFAQRLQALGVSPTIAARMAGPQIGTDTFFTLTYHAASNPTDPALFDLSSQLTIIAGTPFDLFGGGASPDPLVAYQLETDPHRFSRHAFSLVGQFDVAGPVVTQIDFGLDASARQTPLLIDRDRGKVFLAGKVAQGDFAAYDSYVFQAGVVVGDIGAGGIDAGGGEIVLGSVRDTELRVIQAFEPARFEAFGASGGFATLGGDGLALGESGSQQRDFVHVGQRVEPSLTRDTGTSEANVLLAAAVVQAGSGAVFAGFSPDGPAMSAIVRSGDPPIAVAAGTLTIDRAQGDVEATIALRQALSSVSLDLGTSAFRSAYLNDSHFGIASQGVDAGRSGFLVSGKATNPNDPCTCAYLHWGYWAYAEAASPLNANASGVFVAGIPTPSVDMPVAGTATFTGMAEAVWRGASADPFLSPNPTSYARGEVSHRVDFATGTGTGTMTLNDDTFASTSVHIPGQADLVFGFSDGVSKAGSGVGIFTGEQARNLGVVFNLAGDGGFHAAGAIRAERGEITPPTPPH